MHIEDPYSRPEPRFTGSTPDAAPGPVPGAAPMPAPTAAPAEGRLNWLLIAGLSLFALLWPLAEITGMPAGPGRAAAILVITAAGWIGVVGLGRFPRPVLTLALVGLGSGVLSHTLALAFGYGIGPALWALPLALALQSGWGAITGLLAWAVQAALGGRDRRRIRALQDSQTRQSPKRAPYPAPGSDSASSGDAR